MKIENTFLLATRHFKIPFGNFYKNKYVKHINLVVINKNYPTMKLRMLLIFMLLINGCYAQSTINKQNLSKADRERIGRETDALVKAYTDLDIFSGVVLIAQDGKPFYHKAFGLANRETKTPNTTNTRFDIGSMNKSMTKVIVLQMVNEGKLKLSDPLGKYLDGFTPEIAEKVTVEHLLNHASGFEAYHTPEYFELPMSEKTLDKTVKWIQKFPLMFEPGTDQAYSNAGYVLLGAIIEKASGKSYFQNVRERIVEPLGLKNTHLEDKYKVPQRAIGYYKTMRGALEDNEWLQEVPTPAGGFYSTTSDMLKFYRAYHYGDKLWNEATQKLDNFYPFYQQHQTTGGAMTHAGGFEGANTVHYEILRDHISVIVFANMDEPVAEQLGAGILAIIRGKQPEQPALPARMAVYQTFKEKGIDYVKTNFEELTRNFHPEDPKDMILNMIGYNLLYADNAVEVDEAVQIFELNTELFPDVANTWDSLGEAWLKKGDKHKALKFYKKALEVNPDLPSAKKMVKELSQ